MTFSGMVSSRAALAKKVTRIKNTLHKEKEHPLFRMMQVILARDSARNKRGEQQGRQANELDDDTMITQSSQRW